QIARTQPLPFHRRRPGGNGGERERDECVVAGKRQAKKAPGGLVAAHHADRLQPFQEAARGGKIIERTRAFLRARPPLPFDAGMIDAEAGVVEHAERDRDERGEEHLARGADVIAEQHHHRERNREVIGIALLEAERTWLEAEGVLEEPGAENGRGAGNRDCNRHRSDRSRADAADADLAHGNRTLLLNQFLRSFPRKRESSGRLARSFLFTSGSPLSRGRTDKARDLICAGHHLYPYCPYLFRDPYNDATAAMVWGR